MRLGERSNVGTDGGAVLGCRNSRAQVTGSNN